MGLLPAVKALIKTRFPDCVHEATNLTFQKERFYINPNAVGVIEDYLIYYQAIDKTNTSSVRELFDHFWSKPAEYVGRCGTRCDVFAMICDDKNGVPPFKAVTQAKRIVSAAKSYEAKGLTEAVPYPIDAEFDEETGKVCYTDTDEGKSFFVKERICLRRLSMTKSLRAKLWILFHRYIEEKMGWASLGRIFFFDYDKSGPWMFVNVGFKQVQVVHRKDLAHALGESDPAMIWWTKLLRTDSRDIHFMTTDSDTIPLYLTYHSRFPSTSRWSSVWWHCDKETVINYTNFAMKVEERLEMTPMMFSFVCVLLGTDFVSKNWSINWINETKVLNAAREWKPLAGIVNWQAAFNDFICFLYNDEYNKATVAPVPPHMRRPRIVLSQADLKKAFPEKGRVSFPSNENLKMTADLCAFNLLYWSYAADGVSWTTAAKHLLKDDGTYLYA